MTFREYQEVTGRGVPMIVVWTYMLAWFVAHLAFYTITIRHTQGLSARRSVLAGLVAFLGSFAVWITIVR